MWFLILHCFVALFFDSAYAQTTNVIPANEAAAHVNQYATVEGVVAKVPTSKSDNTLLLNIGAAYPTKRSPTGYRPSAVSKSSILGGEIMALDPEGIRERSF
jgi:hypothetical protein